MTKADEAVLGTTVEQPVATTPGGALLEVRDLRVRFETARGLVRAVDGVDLDIAAGRTLGIVGESGSGKSVLSRAIMKILAPNAHVLPGSRILLDGVDLATVSPKRNKHLWGVDLSMVFQDPMTSLTPVLTVGQQLTETLRFHLGLDRRSAKAEAIRLLTEVGIPEPATRFGQYPHHLSGGMRQRVTIALAIACSPKLLIADEPTTALDVTVQQQILDLLRDLQERTDMGMILITHDLGVVAGRTDSIAVMYAGRIVETGPTKQLFSRMRHPYTRALMDAIPRLSDPSHTRLPSIPGRPPTVIDPPPGCSFAPRCPSAQARCLSETPRLVVTDDSPLHSAACFFPLGTPAGDTAREVNAAAGVTAAGTRIDSRDVI
ncbi:ABC transporter ATP-binding protein [Rhodococcus coprophilus]|uniref:Peptide ABC transporter ATP-binding protein n=1 Tax=Rhodococcus coprophilus TaxID=38310 RepID=A0A2X4TPK1_9NOCA|nr:ABC transporter ATP-binding protein [Rhodococcus coprophilus]MBM7461368.1 peptide/nickel transport system ATP-binding protein [Rhodococcus coprophilus]SQI29316.1 peptide ABC transporter ATP-binding protein [Rhodococcus coprophilus]